MLVGRLSRGIDVRDYGSHAMGMANVLRTAGRGPAAVTLALDIGKGAAAARVGKAICGRPGGAAAGLGAVIGHSWPVFAGFRGGKSSATLFGAVGVLSPRWPGCPWSPAPPPWRSPARPPCSRSPEAPRAGSPRWCWGCAAATSPAWPWRSRASRWSIFRHRENIDRLIHGVEPAVGDPEKTLEPAG